MKNKYLFAVAALAFGLAASPAFADVNATMDVEKLKIVLIVQPTIIVKEALIKVVYKDELTDAATAQALVNSVNSDNRVTWAVDNDLKDGVPTNGDPVNMLIVRKALTENSISRNAGIGQLNQDTGNFANQGNVISAGLLAIPRVISCAEGAPTLLCGSETPVTVGVMSPKVCVVREKNTIETNVSTSGTRLSSVRRNL